MKKYFLSAATALAVSATLQAQTTIVNYSTGGTNPPASGGFFNSGNGWSNVGNPLWEGQQGWTGTGTGADSVSVVVGVTPSGAGNASGTLGVFLPALPLNTATPYIERSFTPMSTVTFTNIAVSYVAEWSLLNFGGPGQADTFTLDLRAGGSSALTFLLDPNTAGLGFDYRLSSIGSGSVNQFDTTYGSLLRLQVDIAGTGYSGTWELLDPTLRTVLSSGSLNGGTLAGGFSASDIDSLRLGWQLAGGTNAPGDLGIVVNEFTISSTGDPIPEPGTWAVGALLLSGVAATIYRRRKARAEKSAA